MSIFVLLIIIGALVLGGYYFMKPGTGGQTAAAPEIPPGKEDSYAYGMHPGEDGVPVMYTLTTCGHCVHLKDFLDEHDVKYHLVYVDDFHGQARSGLLAVLKAHNARASYPTFVLPGGRTVVGFRKSEISAALNLPDARPA